MRKLIGKTASKIGRGFTLLSQLLYKGQNSAPNQIYLDAWFQDKGDQTLKIDYGDLNENSIVFDLGGYEGQWSSDIFAKYCCFIYIFEPVQKYSLAIENRFSKNHKIFVLNFGLGNEDSEVIMSVNEYNSSIIRDLNSETEKIKLRKASAFIEENSIKIIDLMKINIEGAEYD
ncbi:MAG: FkbM family methyltransferase, partial [Rhizonema sp. PD38]|nr:FkbM family methyltransferase [Rhizonema sp. PD38]